jgi:hypothetical protein
LILLLMTMSYPDHPVVGFIAAVLVLVPLPRQIRAGNIACLALIFWFFQGCLVNAINAIIWAGNVEDSALVWCDISKFFDLYFYIHLGLIGYQLTDLETVRLLDSQRRLFVSASIWSISPRVDRLLSINAKFVEKYLK